jgi:hypothetical protein
MRFHSVVKIRLGRHPIYGWDVAVFSPKGACQKQLAGAYLDPMSTENPGAILEALELRKSFDYFGTGILIASVYFLIGFPFVRLGRWTEERLAVDKRRPGQGPGLLPAWGRKAGAK